MLLHKLVETLIAKSKTFFLKHNFFFLVAGITSGMLVSCLDFTVLGYLSIHSNNMSYCTFKEID